MRHLFSCVVTNDLLGVVTSIQQMEDWLYHLSCRMGSNHTSLIGRKWKVYSRVDDTIIYL